VERSGAAAVTQTRADEGKTRELPPTLRRAVRLEFARAFHPPYESPIVVAVNGALMSGLWFLLPPHWKNALFSLHGTLAFAMVLASWMLSDVPATNLAGADAVRVSNALDDPIMFRRLFYAKNVVLWVLVAPLCSVIALAIGINAHDATATVVSIVAIAVMPFGVLGISAWLGLWYPYHPVTLHERWSHRRQWRHMIVRWFTLVVAPYGVVPVLSVALLAPSLLLWWAFAQHGLGAPLSGGEFAWGIAVACLLALVCAVSGHRLGWRIARRRREALLAYLADPSLG
jgi:hypothetical protein